MSSKKQLLMSKQSEKTSFVAQINQQSKQQDLLEEKDKQIRELKKIIKKLTKQLKDREQSSTVPKSLQTGNNHFKIILEKQFQRFNELKEVVLQATERLKKFIHQIREQFSLSQTSQTIQMFVKMLDTNNQQLSQSNNSVQSSQYSKTFNSEDQQIFIQQTLDEFQVILRSFILKYGETSRLYKQTLQAKKIIQQELNSTQKQLKNQKKSMVLLQKLLEKNQNQRVQLINQIKNCVNPKQIQSLKNKTKQQILQHSFKLTYRIKDLEKQKQDVMKSSTKNKQKQLQMYQALYQQVKGIKDKSRMRQSIA